MTLIIVNTIAVALETVPSFAARHAGSPWALEIFSVTIFTIEYALRVWVARDHPGHAHETPWRARRAYSRSPLAVIDLATILPFYLAMYVAIDLRALRLLRVLRILKLTRYSRALRTMAAVARKESRAILGALCILVVVVMIASTAIVSGDVEVDLPDGATHLGPGHFFDEVALIEQTDRQATVTSLTDCQLMRLDGTDFRELMRKEPDLEAEIMRIAASRRAQRA